VDLLWFPWPDKATGTIATQHSAYWVCYSSGAALNSSNAVLAMIRIPMGLTTRFNLLTRRKTLGGLAG
jgi:hypothetical protein